MAYSETGTPFTLSANIPTVYSAAHYFAGIPLISSVLLNDIAKGLMEEMCECTEFIFRIYGVANGEVFIKHEIKLPRFRLSDYTVGKGNGVSLDLSEFRLIPDADFLSALCTPVSTTVTMSVTVSGRSAVRSFGVKLLPFGYVCPEMPPELCASYVLSGCGLARRAADTYGSDKAPSGKNAIFSAAELCASVMRSVSFTYSPLQRELLHGECVIRDFDSVATSNNRSLSLTEAVLLYCSMAESIGLRPMAVFLKKDTGAVKALVGINFGQPSRNAVCESLIELRERILEREAFFFDILGLLGTEAMDFSRNASETTSAVFRTSASTVLAIDVAAARALGVRSVRPMYNEAKPYTLGEYKGIGEVLKKTDEVGKSRSLFGFSPYTARSLGICAKANSLEFGKEYTLYAIDEDVLFTDPDSFSYISTFKINSATEHPRNMTEQAAYDSKIKKLIGRIESERAQGGLCTYSASEFLSGKKLSGKMIRDDFNSDVAFLCEAVRNKLLTDGHVDVYAATGCVTFKRDGKVVYAPCAYVPCSLRAETESVTLTYGTDRAILNTNLADETESVLGRPVLGISDISLGSAARREELSQILSHYARLSNYDSEFTYHPDTFLSVFDLSYTLMRSCIESTDGRLFERYMLEGTYTPIKNDRYFSDRPSGNLPLAVPSELIGAVQDAEKNSVIIKGPHGCGKKAAAVSIAARNHAAGNDTLICSKFSETLESVRGVFEEAGLSELCIVLADDEKTRNRILSDIKLLTTSPEAPKHVDGEISEIEEALSEYSERLHESRVFGYSLYECLNEYCLCSERCTEDPLPVSLSAYELTENKINELLEVSEKFCEISRTLSEKAVGAAASELMLDKLGITAPPKESTKELLCDAADELELFAVKSAAARHYLGIPQKALTDVRCLRAFGDFLESVIFSGIDFMPEKLLGGGAYANAKKVERVCSVIEELCGFDGKLDDVSEEIANISARTLYSKWQIGEANPFVRAAVLHETKKYLPSQRKITNAEAGAILKLLARREELTSELDSLTPECSEILGGLWKGLSTDIETARRAARFAVLSESCSGRMSRGSEEGVDLRKGITTLINGLKNESEARADLLLSAGAFRKLAGAGGLIESVSRELILDPYELSFEDGLLSENGLARLLRALSENTAVLCELPEYNLLKKRALSLGIPAFTEYARAHNGSAECSRLFRKSIFAHLSSSVINGDRILSEVSSEDFEYYLSLFEYEKKRVVYKTVSAHREGFSAYISTPDGKNELKALYGELHDPSFTVFELFSRHSAILRAMYSVILARGSDTYRFGAYPSLLILFDCDKTDAAEAIPLCAHFDRCVFVSGPYVRRNSIMKLLPKGLPTYKSSRVLYEKCGSAVQLCKSFSEGLTFTRASGASDVHFVKCEGGMYDRNTRSNRIEALCACETALAASKKLGLERVGILAATVPQAAEIIQILGVLAGKYGDKAISKIPVRYIGKVGDFSREVIVFSATFGKNVYSVTRSFGIFDSYGAKNGVSSEEAVAAVTEELLCAGKKLFVVSSVEPSDILTDTLGCGAAVLSAILGFARYGVIPRKLAASSPMLTGGIERSLAMQLCEGESMRICESKGVIYSDDTALIYDSLREDTCGEGIYLRHREFTQRGYKTSFVLPTELLPKSINEE